MLWAYIKQKMAIRPTNLPDFKDVIERCWREIQPELCAALYSTIPERLAKLKTGAFERKVSTVKPVIVNTLIL
jgi:hypothetical protein